MIKIGAFSKLGKTTVKTIRYYEKEGILMPIFIDGNRYRYYDTKQLLDLSEIVSYRQIGISIKEIKNIKKGMDVNQILLSRKEKAKQTIEIANYQLTQINFLMEEKNMEYKVVLKDLPECIVYYKEGVISEYKDMTNFIIGSGEECLKLNPELKCIEPSYCYVNYLDNEYRKDNIRIRYAQAVEKKGIENNNIKFEHLKSTKAVCLYHKGPYHLIGSAYATVYRFIKENKLTIVDNARECYIDGMWNKENVEDWLTEIQIPVK